MSALVNVGFCLKLKLSRRLLYSCFIPRGTQLSLPVRCCYCEAKNTQCSDFFFLSQPFVFTKGGRETALPRIDNVDVRLVTCKITEAVWRERAFHGTCGFCSCEWSPSAVLNQVGRD